MIKKTYRKITPNTPHLLILLFKPSLMGPPPNDTNIRVSLFIITRSYRSKIAYFYLRISLCYEKILLLFH
jgi:hypothetical protein